jgi:hypothetical protein
MIITILLLPLVHISFKDRLHSDARTASIQMQGTASIQIQGRGGLMQGRAGA